MTLVLKPKTSYPDFTDIGRIERDLGAPVRSLE